MLRTRRLTGACVGLAAAVTASLLPLAAAAPAQAATTPVPSSYFGVHDGNVSLTSWAKAPVGSIRIWDNATTWANIEPTEPVGGRHTWQVAKLDGIVKNAVAHHAAPVIVLGSTPAWASRRVPVGGRHPQAFVSPGAADPPNLTAWAAYVKFIVSRYKAKGVHEYQVWNEPDVIAFWNGNQIQMKQLSDIAASVIRSTDRTAKVIAPSFVVRLPDAQRWFAAYAKTGALKNVDAVSLQLYPLANQTPEGSISLLRWAKGVLAANRVVKPIWNSEINYGMPGGRQKQRVLSEPLAAAYVGRTMLLNRANGVSRVFWYNWAHNPLLGIQMSRADGHLTAAAAAFTTSRRWLAGQVLQGCTVDRRNTYRCVIRTARTFGYAYWNAGTYRPIITAPRGTYQAEYLSGGVTSLRSGAKVRMGQAPIIVRVHR